MEESSFSFVEFLQANTSALFSLFGVIIGAFLSYIASLSLSKRDLKLRLREKLLDKRIFAHEQVLALAKSLRKMVNLREFDEEGNLNRSPYFLITLEAFRNHQAEFSSLFGHSSTWLSIDLVRELNLLQDYFVNVDLLISEIQPELLPIIGNILRTDFINFSTDIERIAYSFFEKDLNKLSLNSLYEWHKYPIEETERRLRETALINRRAEIDALSENRN